MSDRGEPASVLDVKADDEALVYLENMPDGLIEKHFALKVSHDLVDLYRGRSVVPLGEVPLAPRPASAMPHAARSATALLVSDFHARWRLLSTAGVIPYAGHAGPVLRRSGASATAHGHAAPNDGLAARGPR